MKYYKDPAKMHIKVAVLGLLVLSAHCLDAPEQDPGDAAVSAPTPTALAAPDLVKKYQATITESDLAAQLYVFASDFFEGRETGTRGQHLAALYLASQYRKMGVSPRGTFETDDPLAPENYFQPFTISYQTFQISSENVVAFIEGSDPELKHEALIISSHYDHIGITEGEGEDRINNGADDDGSGTVAVLEIAEAFKMAEKDGYGPRRSIIFLNVSGEEKGLLGSTYYADVQPIFPLENTVADLNIDMIGRFDPTHPTNSQNYVYIIGSNLISQELHDLNAELNEVTGINLELDERYNSKDDPNQFYRRSDHWNFGKHNIPFIFFFTGTHEDYHGVDDEPHKIEYPRMARIARLIFATAWQVANQDERPAVSGQGFN